MSTIAIIPARYASTRLPGKPLLRETGKYLIQHVYEQVLRSKEIDACLIATDDARIADAVRSFSGSVAMTRADHATGTDRIAEVVRTLAPDVTTAVLSSPACELAANADLAADYLKSPSSLGRSVAPSLILNVQGDEPEIDPAALDQLIARMQRDPSTPMGTLACPFPSNADPRDPNAVKVVLDSRNEALYFSRALIPYPRDPETSPSSLGRSVAPSLLHVGVYAYRPNFLLEMASWPPGRLEQIEKLEQLRVLERGHKIAVEIIPAAAPGIDTPADYAAFVARCARRD